MSLWTLIKLTAALCVIAVMAFTGMLAYHVTVRPLGSTRLEIILPTGDAGSSGGKSNLTSDEIDEVKRLVSQMGVLEFRRRR